MKQCRDCGEWKDEKTGFYWRNDKSRPICRVCARRKARSVKGNCQICGKEFLTTQALIKIGFGKYCSHACSTLGKRATGATTQCEVCGKSVHVQLKQIGRRGRFCSKECSLIGMKRRDKEVLCQLCGSIFVVPDWANKKNKKFCSNACSLEWKKTHSTLVACSCRVCGKEMKAEPNQVRNGGKRYCSRACHLKWVTTSGERRGAANGNYNSVEVICPWCLRTFMAQPNRIKKGVQTFCGRNCLAEWQSENLSGPNHWNWKGGNIEDYGPNWGLQRGKTRERDGYACRRCGVRQVDYGRALDVHHIRPFRDFGYVVGKNENYREANDLVNLLSVCRRCHAIIERNPDELSRILDIITEGRD